jgi:hypothetical protein
MMKVYKSEKDITIYILLAILVVIEAFFIYNIMFTNSDTSLLIPFFIILLASSYVFRAFSKTIYAIKNDSVYYEQVFFKGSIPINSIKKIVFNENWVISTTYKPALSHKGIYIYYNKYDEVFISPKNRSHFVEELLKTNPNIEIKK